MNLRRFFVYGMLACVFSAGAATSLAASKNTLQPSDRPTEVYGNRGAYIILRIANDSAGTSGLLRALSRDYLARHHVHGAIAWYQDSDVNALKQLHGGHVDMALVTERRLADAATDTQSASSPSEVFRSRSVLVGPIHNPAHVSMRDSSVVAFRKIQRVGNIRVAAGGAPLFLSRDDRSANNEKERAIWARAGLTPWVSHDLWYRSDPVFAQRALIDANRESLYTLTDYATWEVTAPRLPKMRLYVAHGRELESADLAVLRPYPSARVRSFLRYLQSERAQTIIARYGTQRATNRALFLPKN